MRRKDIIFFLPKWKKINLVCTGGGLGGAGSGGSRFKNSPGLPPPQVPRNLLPMQPSSDRPATAAPPKSHSRLERHLPFRHAAHHLHSRMLWPAASGPPGPAGLVPRLLRRGLCPAVGVGGCERHGRRVSAAHSGEGFSAAPDLAHGLYSDMRRDRQCLTFLSRTHSWSPRLYKS